MINTGYGTVQAMRYTDHKSHVKYVCKHCLLTVLKNNDAVLLTQLEDCYPHVEILEQTEEEIVNQTEKYAPNIATIKYVLQTEKIRVYNARDHRYLREGYIYTDQQVLNKKLCSTCHRSLREDCTDY